MHFSKKLCLFFSEYKIVCLSRLCGCGLTTKANIPTTVFYILIHMLLNTFLCVCVTSPFSTLALLTLNRVRRERMQIQKVVTKSVATLSVRARRLSGSVNKKLWTHTTVGDSFISKSIQNHPQQKLVTSVELYSTFISVMLFMVLNMDGTPGTRLWL